MRNRVGMMHGFAFLCLVACGYAQNLRVDGYTAIVNDRVITIGDVMDFIRPVEQQLRYTYEGVELDAKLEEAFIAGRGSLVERALILEDFERQEGMLPDRAIDDYTANIIHEQFEDDRATFLQELAREQMTMHEWREQVKERLVVMIMRRQAVFQRVVVTPREVREAYEENNDAYQVPAKVKLAMIVLNKGATEEDQTVKKGGAKRVVERLREGEDFAALAESVSEGSKASRGGDWGWINPADLRTELAQAATGLEPGQISEVIEAGDAFYVLRVAGRKEASTVPFGDVRDEIQKGLRRAEEIRVYKAWVDRLREKYYVRIFEDEEATH